MRTHLSPYASYVDMQAGRVGRRIFTDPEIYELRVKKLRTGFAWAEDPPSRTRHLVDNVQIIEKRSNADLTLTCNFIVYRSRLALGSKNLSIFF